MGLFDFLKKKKKNSDGTEMSSDGIPSDQKSRGTTVVNLDDTDSAKK